MKNHRFAKYEVGKTKTFLTNLLDRYFPPYILFLTSLFAITVLLYSMFRVATLYYNRSTTSVFKSPDMEILSAFWIGLRFDAMVASTALVLPFLVLTSAYFWLSKHKATRESSPNEIARQMGIDRFVRIYFLVAILIAFMICAADLPYFHFFNSRFNRTALTLRNLPHSLGHIVREPAYYPMIIMSGFAIFGVNRMINWLWATMHKDLHSHKGTKAIISGVLFLLMLVGVFGVRRPATPTMNRATFSTDGFYNQLALNPVHTFFDSFIKWNLPYVPIPIAISKVRNELHVADGGVDYTSPLAHKHNGKGRKLNVVLLLMEGMSADYMGVYGKSPGFTPGLDSIARENIFFEHCYSNGIHTNAGLFSSIYGMPIFMLDHPMLDPKAMAADFTGLPVTLAEHGYSTQFFCTHGKSFDNLDRFLSKNGYEHIHDVACYPRERSVGVWGVPDETLAEHAFETLDSLAKNDKKPFFATILSISSHPPYDLPLFTSFLPGISSDSSKVQSLAQLRRDRAYEYADWAITNFIRTCQQAEWAQNTIFVMVGDHGLKLDDNQDVPLSYNHVPLIVIAPALFDKGKVMHGMANQTDIFPTVMGMLGLPYIQNTLGYDLMHETRPYAFFSQDEKLGVINDKFLFVSRKSGHESISLYNENQGIDLSDQYGITKEEMRSYANQMLQVSEWMIEKNLTRPMKGQEKN
jgi:phosphoglycerol transferase MdoB-like AlkP superfamily enzyme